MNRHVSYAEFTKDPAKHLDEARDQPVYIDDSGVVIMSEEEYEGWKETQYLLSSPENATDLMRAIKGFEQGEQ